MEENAEWSQETLDDMMRRTISKHDVHVESIERSAGRTHLLMKDLDTVLNGYKVTCLNSARENERRRWRVLEARYLKDPRCSTQQIAEAECLEIRTIQKDLQDAVGDLTIALFGSEGLHDIA